MMPLLADFYQRDPAVRVGEDFHERRVQPLFREVFHVVAPNRVAADSRAKIGVGEELFSSQCLIRALAALVLIENPAEHGFAYPLDFARFYDHIHIRAADYQNAFFFFHNYFSLR